MKPKLKRTIFLLLSICFLITFPSCNERNGNTAEKDLLDKSGIDTSIRPQDDFFHYVNGGWVKKTQIPASEAGWGSFVMLQQKTQKELKSILDSCEASNAPRGSNAQKVGDFYASAMDSSTIEKKGFQPLEGDLQRINNLHSSRDVLKEMAFEYSIGLSPLIRFFAHPDAKNSDVMMAYFTQGGLGLPNKDYYTKNDSSTENIRQTYTKYIAKIFTLAGDDSMNAITEAGSVMKIEYALANASKRPVELRDPYANYHKMAVSESNAQEPDINWPWLVDQLGIKADSIVIGQPTFYLALNKMLETVPVSDWKNYLRFHYLNFFAPYLSTPFVNAKFELEKMLSGQKELQPRWKRMTRLTDKKLGDALGELYVKKYFPPEAKKRILDLVNNLQQTYKERIDSLTWMSDSTKQKAIVKLNAFVKKIGYPDKWKDYSSVDISKSDFIQNLKNTGHFAYEYMINKIGKPVDRSEWFMTPPTINAYYSTSANDINFPAGILQPPFFYKDGDDALNYGAIGVVIGHEMTHGFDDQGRKFDAHGNLKNWWLPADSIKFQKRANLVVNQYNHSLVVDTLHINGELTQGENIADIGGVTIAFAAFKKTTEGKSGKRIDGLTPDQRFFMAYAEILRSKMRPEIERKLVMSDPHSMPMYRVNNPLSDISAFYSAFNVKPGDKMYLPDSLRAQVW